jgi:maleate cis-trans isomerase
MILLQAIRLDAYDRFQFRIEAATIVPVVTSDPAQAAALLRQLGVRNPDPLLAHVRLWGQVEIPDPSA